MDVIANRIDRHLHAQAFQTQGMAWRWVRRSISLKGRAPWLLVCIFIFSVPVHARPPYHPSLAFSFSAEPYDAQDANGHFVQDFKRDYYFNFYNVVESTPIYIMVCRSYRCDYYYHDYQVSGAQLVYSTRHMEVYGLQVPLIGGRIVVTERLKPVGMKTSSVKKWEAIAKAKKRSYKTDRIKRRWPSISVSDPIPLCMNVERYPIPPGEKTTTGAFIPLNDDDDDRNGQPDWKDETNKGEDNDLVRLVARHPPTVPVSLTWNPAIVRLYKTSTKKYKGEYSSLMGNGTVSYKGYDNQIVYVEGVSPGAAYLTITGPGGFKDRLKITVTRIDMVMDGNRDGIIDFDNTNDNHSIFWVNDDRDQLHYEEKEWHEDDVAVDGHPDCKNDTIGEIKGFNGGCRRDLEDFTRLHVRVDDNTAKQPGVSYYLKFDSPIGRPQINIFEAVNESLDYLRNGSIADRQIQKKKVMTVGAQENQLPSQYIRTENQRSCFILEGSGVGKGNLTLIVKKEKAEIYRKAITLELRPIDWFYQVFKVASVGEKSRLVNNYHPDFTRSDDYLLVVHGFNVNPTDKIHWPATVFKRLWWQDYKGHVGFFDWPCVLANPRNPQCYDDSEYNAWRCGAALLDRINQLNSGGHAGKVRLLAHSQGNVVAGEALRLASGQVLHTYIASQAAIAGDCYQTGLPSYFSKYSTPNVLTRYPETGHPYVSDISSKVKYLLNYYNYNDWALRTAKYTSWEINNKLKPDIGVGYYYNEVDGNKDTYNYPDEHFYYAPPVVPSRTLVFPNDRYEIFSYAAEARSYALGTLSSVNSFKAFDLQNLNYTSRRYSHSRQFRSNIVDEFPYWKKVKKDCSF